MRRQNKVIILINCIVPLLLGALIYYFLSPDVLFVQFLNGIIGKRVCLTPIAANTFVLQFVRFYFLDMLWSYALVFALYVILDDNTAKLKKIILIAFLFSTFMELLQLLPYVEGTFDFVDILLEFVSEVFAVFIIKRLMRRHQQ